MLLIDEVKQVRDAARKALKELETTHERMIKGQYLIAAGDLNEAIRNLKKVLGENMETKKQYAYTIKGGDFYNGPYDSVEQTINEAIDDSDLEVGDVLEVGEVCLYSPHISAQTILDDLADNAVSECGEAADEWPDTSEEEEAELETKINEVLNEWLDKTGNKPQFFSVDTNNIQEVKITQEMLDAAEKRKVDTIRENVRKTLS